MSTQIIIINKSGKVVQQSVSVNLETLYKKASFKSSDNFEQKHVWNNLHIDKMKYDSIVVYGKTVGNAGQENKFDFPPPIDNTLFFGNLLIVRYDLENNPINLCIDDWKSIYNFLMGGFECLDDTDDEESEDEEIVDKSKLDKYGYEKDGFVVEEDEGGGDEEAIEEEDGEMAVSDSESESDSDSDSESDEEEEFETESGSSCDEGSDDDEDDELKEEEYFAKID
jgi:hypothetical protein